MIRARPYQQQPATPTKCPFCHEAFNNRRRVSDHLRNKAGCAEARKKLVYGTLLRHAESATAAILDGESG